MKRSLLSMTIISCFIIASYAQTVTAPKFGSGLINIMAKDSTFTMKIGMRFQNLLVTTWRKEDAMDGGSFANPETNFLIRRARIKFNGYAYNPKLQYKLELGLSNNDLGGGGDQPYSDSPRLIYDAWVEYQFHKNWAIKFGQGKLPGNRERVISSGNLQFVDRSRLNSRFNIDRDFGAQLKHTANVTGNIYTEVVFAITQGEGRNLTSGNVGGLDYTLRGEILPFGKFKSKGDYTGSSTSRESSPKLALGVTYDLNQKAGKTRGQHGNFIAIENEDNLLDLTTVFADLMFKYQGLSIMAEYANKSVPINGQGVVENGVIVDTYVTGNAFNIQGGYMFDNNYEIALRYTTVSLDEPVGSRSEPIYDQDNRYTLGLNKFIVGHKLKLQTDITYRDQDFYNDELTYRFQMELHF